jgi:hypothetical protein
MSRPAAARQQATRSCPPPPPLRPSAFEITVRSGIAGEVSLVLHDANGCAFAHFYLRERALSHEVIDHLREWLPELLELDQRGSQLCAEEGSGSLGSAATKPVSGIRVTPAEAQDL